MIVSKLCPHCGEPDFRYCRCAKPHPERLDSPELIKDVKGEAMKDDAVKAAQEWLANRMASTEIYPSQFEAQKHLRNVLKALAALTADLAARGETIVRLEGEIERMIQEEQRVSAIIGTMADPVYATAVGFKREIVRLEAQLIEERWQKNRAEWQRDHRCEMNPDWGNNPSWSHCTDPRHAFTDDDWRRDAREQLVAEGKLSR